MIDVWHLRGWCAQNQLLQHLWLSFLIRVAKLSVSISKHIRFTAGVNSGSKGAENRLGWPILELYTCHVWYKPYYYKHASSESTRCRPSKQCIVHLRHLRCQTRSLLMSSIHVMYIHRRNVMSLSGVTWKHKEWIQKLGNKYVAWNNTRVGLPSYWIS